MVAGSADLVEDDVVVLIIPLFYMGRADLRRIGASGLATGSRSILILNEQSSGGVGRSTKAHDNLRREGARAVFGATYERREPPRARRITKEFVAG